jgi:hypothetical protein
MRISKQAIELFKSFGSSAGSVHRVCMYRHGVYAESAANAINQVAQNGFPGDTSQLHLAVFELAKRYDAEKRERISHDYNELLTRVQRLEQRGFLKWLENIFNQGTPLLW